MQCSLIDFLHCVSVRLPVWPNWPASVLLCSVPLEEVCAGRSVCFCDMGPSVHLLIHPFNYQNVRSIFKLLLSLWLTGCVGSLFTTKRFKIWYIKYYLSLGQSCTHFQSDVNCRPGFNHSLWAPWGEQGWLDKKSLFSEVWNCCWGLLFHFVVNERAPVSAKGLQSLFPTLASSWGIKTFRYLSSEGVCNASAFMGKWSWQRSVWCRTFAKMLLSVCSGCHSQWPWWFFWLSAPA